MSISYDVFTDAFLGKITDFNFITMREDSRQQTIDEYMKRACSQFGKVCKHDIISGDDNARELYCDIEDTAELEEIIDIVSEGMVVQWMKPFVYKSENLENILNTKDYESYSPAELLYRIKDTYKEVKAEFEQMVLRYSYAHGALDELHT